MPKRKITGTTSKRSKKRKTSELEGHDCDVKEVLGCRISLKNESGVEMEFFVSWIGFDNSHNSYEPYDNLMMNSKLTEYIDEIFKKKELEIYVTTSNIKEQIKKKIRRSLALKKKMEIMFEVWPFDPKEYRTTLAFYHVLTKPTEVFKKHLENFVYRSYFFEMEKNLRIKHDAIIEEIKRIDGEDIHFTIENDEDFDELPAFTYIKKNFLADEVNTTIIESPTKPEGCACEGGKCSRVTTCCPKLVKEPFAYKKDKKGIIMKLEEMEKIYECGDHCKCGPDCVNRVSQRPTTVSLCLFKTLNGRGWGVKATNKIREGTFILEYRGELLGHHEAGKRTESRYLFDLNMDRSENGFYTIDAFKYGSLGRFVNHSCEPNAKMWFINDVNRDPKSQKLCIFADRDIEADEEITIDYSPKETVPSGAILNVSHSLLPECNCGTLRCRGTIS